jgi:hypothetical protein
MAGCRRIRRRRGSRSELLRQDLTRPKRSTGEVMPAKQGKPGLGLRCAWGFIFSLIREVPDITLNEIAGAVLLHLQPYGPDFNPIENAFAKLNAHVRKAAARNVEALEAAVATALRAFEPPNAQTSSAMQVMTRINRNLLQLKDPIDLCQAKFVMTQAPSLCLEISRGLKSM